VTGFPDGPGVDCSGVLTPDARCGPLLDEFRSMLRALNWALPGRPEAIAAREREHRRRLEDSAAVHLATERAERARQERPRPPIRL
jgi:hypothetical protein